MAKKSLFEKLGLVESDEPMEPGGMNAPDTCVGGFGDLSGQVDCLVMAGPIQAEVPEGDTIDVQAVYEANNMNPADDITVYKIKDMLDSLPSEMSNKNKKATLKNLMNTLGYNVASIMGDAAARIDTLNAAANQKTTALNDEINENSHQIEEMKLEIERLTARNADAAQAINSIIETVTAERHNIEGVLDFIRDEPAGKEDA